MTHAGFSLLTLVPGRVGGSETYARGLLEAYAAGHGPERVTVLANASVARVYGAAASGPVELHRVRSYRPGQSTVTRALAMAAARAAPRRVAREVPPGLDVLHFPVTVPIPDVRGVPRVATVFDVQHHELPEFFSPVERRYRAWAYDDAARRADLVVTLSDHAAGGLVRHVGVERERIAVIPSGIDHARFHPGHEAAPALDALGLPERFLVYPANLWPHKNHERLVRALARTSDASVELVLSGQTYGRLGGLLTLARRLGVGERVRHVGYLPGAAVPEFLRRATAMVFPSLFEGFGAPPLEAMACGCPVAASREGSLPEVVGDAALLFDAFDEADIARAIDALAGDEGLRDTLRDEGRRKAARYTWRTSAERHVEAYGRAIAAR